MYTEEKEDENGLKFYLIKANKIFGYYFSLKYWRGSSTGWS